MGPELEAVRSALATSRNDLLRRANVVATGVGFKRAAGERTGELSVVCSVTRKLPTAQLAAGDLLPREVAGVRTDVVQTGVIRALEIPAATPAEERPEPRPADATPDPKLRYRPAPGGASIGHASITAGTLGTLVRKSDRLLILSNNHVLAAVNAGLPGDAILQPGPYDGGADPADRIAVLETFVPLAMTEEPSSCPFARGVTGALNALARLLGSDARVRAVSMAVAENLVDCALAAPLGAALVSAEILGIGVPAGTARGELGMRLRKSGRTTGLTVGEIEQVDVTVDVAMGGRTARFADQLLAGAMSAGGDSGSLAVDDSGRAVGLLFAGSESTTLFNRIENVFAALGVTLP